MPAANSQTDAAILTAVLTKFPHSTTPGAVGQTDLLRIRGGARMQWVGIDNAPRTFIATADMPLRLGESSVSAWGDRRPGKRRLVRKIAVSIWARNTPTNCGSSAANLR